MSKWEKVSSKEVFKNKWLSLHVDKVITPDGKDGEYSVVDICESVAVVAMEKSNRIWMVNLFRYPIQEFSWEIVKGRCDGEDPALTSQRELEEELGLKAEKWIDLGSFYPFGAIFSGKMYCYLAENLTETGKNEQAEEGIQKAEAFTLKEIDKMISNSIITDAQTITAIAKVKGYMEKKND